MQYFYAYFPLRRVLQTFIEYYNTARPHQGFEQQTPILYPQPTSTGPVQRTIVLGFISDYYRGADQATICPA